MSIYKLKFNLIYVLTHFHPHIRMPMPLSIPVSVPVPIPIPIHIHSHINIHYFLSTEHSSSYFKAHLYLSFYFTSVFIFK